MLQFPDCHAEQVTLHDLIHSWMQDTNMLSALTSPSPVLCFQLDCFAQIDEEVQKIWTSLQLCGHCHVPLFTDDRDATTMLAYVVAAAVLHRGDEELGHYQSMLRVGPLTDDTFLTKCASMDNTKWLLTDDGMQTRLIHGWPRSAAKNTAVLWLCRADVTPLPEAPLPWQDAHDQMLRMLCE